MPRGDRTGPQSQGPKTGKGQGRSNPQGAIPDQEGPGGMGTGRGQGQGAGRGARLGSSQGRSSRP